MIFMLQELRVRLLHKLLLGMPKPLGRNRIKFAVSFAPYYKAIMFYISFRLIFDEPQFTIFKKYL